MFHKPCDCLSKNQLDLYLPVYSEKYHFAIKENKPSLNRDICHVHLAEQLATLQMENFSIVELNCILLQDFCSC